jgi:hypothetical protein
MTKYKIDADGHSGEVEIAYSGVNSFAGRFSSDQGNGFVSGEVLPDKSLAGEATLNGHCAGFKAQIDGANISGTFHFGWLFSVDFTGTEVADA